jgi:hypothetical protein
VHIFDGLKNLLSSLANERNAVNANSIVSTRVQPNELRAIYRTGLGNKIVRIKNGYALKKSIKFADVSEEQFYNRHIQKAVKKAGSFMLAFGRAVILINVAGCSDHTQPLTETPERYKLDVFSGDMVNAQNVSIDLANDRYNQPTIYNVRGFGFHHSRVIDFRYVEPPEMDLALYNYGGIPEFELIYNQLINDGVVERASASILDRSSTMFYKVKGLKAALQAKQESDILQFFSLTERARSIFGAGLIDSEDGVENVTQALTNLDSADQITLRRLAMVTGIPLAILVGESVRGMNSTGDTEKEIFNEMISTLQEDYYLEPINELLDTLGRKPIEFSESQNITATEKIEYEGKAIKNALDLFTMGEDYSDYLIDRGIIQKDDFGGFFEDSEDASES